MAEKVGQITRNTLIPIGLVVAIVVSAFYLGGERQAMSMRVDANTSQIFKTDELARDNAKRLAEHDLVLNGVKAGVRRLEQHFGTLPGKERE